MGIGSWIGGVVQGVGSTIVSPIKEVMVKREERKQAHETMMAQLRLQKQTDDTAITVKTDDLEAVLSTNLTQSFKDEYVTISMVGFTINGVMLGGILDGFGYPKFLAGLKTGLTFLVSIGVPIGYLVTAVICGAIGMSFNRIFK